MGDTGMGCPGSMLEGKGLAASGWGGTWIQVRRSPPEASGLCHEALGSCGADASLNGRRTDEVWRQEKVQSSRMLAEEGLGALNRGGKTEAGGGEVSL